MKSRLTRFFIIITLNEILNIILTSDQSTKRNITLLKLNYRYDLLTPSGFRDPMKVYVGISN